MENNPSENQLANFTHVIQEVRENLGLSTRAGDLPDVTGEADGLEPVEIPPDDLASLGRLIANVEDLLHRVNDQGGRIVVLEAKVQAAEDYISKFMQQANDNPILAGTLKAMGVQL